MLEDYGEFEAEDGTVVLLKKNSQVCKFNKVCNGQISVSISLAWEKNKTNIAVTWTLMTSHVLLACFNSYHIVCCLESGVFVLLHLYCPWINVEKKKSPPSPPLSFLVLSIFHLSRCHLSGATVCVMKPTLWIENRKKIEKLFND